MQPYPALEEATEAALRISIERFGVLMPVVLDQNGNLLDGNHRQRIADELNVYCPVEVVEVASEDEAAEIARTLNEDRRHIPPELRKQVVADLRGKGFSYRAIGGALGVGKSTAYDDMRGVRSRTPAEPPTITGQDGKSYPARRPHVANNSGENEWYTPPEYIAAAREAMGGIDLDPASNEIANTIVGATRFFTAAEDGLCQDWHGRVWLNPPYSQPEIARFSERIVNAFNSGEIDSACILVNNATETDWFQSLLKVARAVCFPRGRIRFLGHNRRPGTPLQGQAVLYLGSDLDTFARAFERFGEIWYARRD